MSSFSFALVASREFDVNRTLLKRDVWRSTVNTDGGPVETINVRIKSSKTSTVGNRGEVVQVFANGTKFCPVGAIKAYMALNKKGARGKPFFREDNGWGMSLKRFNDYLRKVLEDKIEYNVVTAHSFRSGTIPTEPESTPKTS